jgi:hypothetical protein
LHNPPDALGIAPYARPLFILAQNMVYSLTALMVIAYGWN